MLGDKHYGGRTKEETRACFCSDRRACGFAGDRMLCWLSCDAAAGVSGLYNPEDAVFCRIFRAVCILGCADDRVSVPVRNRRVLFVPLRFLTGTDTLQEEYHIFSSDVLCSVPYHSQYLASVHFEEIYAPVSPIYYVHKTERAANVDLATGEEYKLSDVIQIDDAFVGFWCEQIDKSEEYDDLAFDDKEVRESFVAWFLGKDEKLDEYYMFNPFFYIDENKDFVIGISCDPKPSIVGGYQPSDDSFSVRIEYAALEPYRIDSEFWELYEKSESTGEVLECEDLKENLWLGKDAGVWDMWKE